LYLTFGLSQLLHGGADPTELSLRWTELEPAIAGRRVRTALPNGTRIEGRVAAVEPEGLRIRITKVSARRVQPKERPYCLEPRFPECR